MSTKKLSGGIWPTIADVTSARKAGLHGVFAATGVASFTFVFVLLSLVNVKIIPGLDLWALIDAAIFGVLAFYINRMSRTAAITALSLFFYEILYMSITIGKGPSIVALFFVLAFVNGIRGTFAYHKFSIEPSTQSPGNSPC